MRKISVCLAMLGAAACATSASQGNKPAAADEPKPAAATPGTVKDPAQQLAFHIAAMVKAIKDAPECEGGGAAALAHLEKNRAEMKEAVHRLKTKAAELSTEASEKYFADTLKLVEELSPGAEERLKDFAQRCPTQDQAINEALGTLEQD